MRHSQVIAFGQRTLQSGQPRLTVPFTIGCSMVDPDFDHQDWIDNDAKWELERAIAVREFER